MTPFAALARAQAEHFAAARAAREAAKPEAPAPTPQVQEAPHVQALRLALPIVERAAAMRPTTPGRIERQREASKAAEAIRVALAALSH